jgi:hypothetical protein
MLCVFNIVPKILALTSNIKNLIFFNKWQYYDGTQCPRKYITLSSFILSISDSCRFHARVAGHILFVTLGSHTICYFRVTYYLLL